MAKKKIYQINDRTMKYISLVQIKRRHQFWGLPGTFEARYPQEIVFPNMDSGRVDEYYSTKEGLIINLEEETKDVNEDTLKKISKYPIFADYMYSKKPYVGIITHNDPKGYPQHYERSPSIIIKVHYYYIPQEDLWKKYENIINKIGQKEKLSEKEALDVAFVPKYISKEHGPFITESLAKAFKHAIIDDRILKRDIGVLLGAMILKHIDDDEKENELMEEIGMKQIENEIRIIAREEFKEELQQVEKEKMELELEYSKVKKEKGELKKENDKVKKEKGELKKENDKVKKEKGELKKGINRLKEINDLNSKEARKIINTLSLL